MRRYSLPRAYFYVRKRQKQRLGVIPGGSNTPPSGYVFLTDADGTILTDADGAKLMEPA